MPQWPCLTLFVLWECVPEVEGECLNEDIVEEDSEERGENVDEGDVEHDAAPGEHSLNSFC